MIHAIDTKLQIMFLIKKCALIVCYREWIEFAIGNSLQNQFTQ